MQREDARFIKRKVRLRAIDVHPIDTALVIDYELEASIVDKNDECMLSDRKDCQKIIRLKGLNPNADCASLAKEVVEKCTLIPPSKIADIEHIICYLQTRKPNCTADICENDKLGETILTAEGSSEKQATLMDLEKYVELLYEDLPEKIKGSAFLLQLAKNPKNLKEICGNNSLVSALARVLREDWKRSIELCINLVGIFSCLSAYTTFHHIISQYRIGSLCFEMVKHDFNRRTEIAHKAEEVVGKPVRSRLPVPRNIKSAFETNKGKNNSSHIPVPGSRRHSSAEEMQTVSNDHEEYKQQRTLVSAKRQDKLLEVCFTLLMNFANNEKIEDKMRKRNIVCCLNDVLARESVTLLLIAISFLTKLSTRKENVQQMVQLNTIDKLQKLFRLKICHLEQSMIHLLYNLSFEIKCREQIVKVGLLPELMTLLGGSNDSGCTRLRGLLYHLTMDDDTKILFCHLRYISNITEMVLTSDKSDNGDKSDKGGDELLASICINLSVMSCNAITMADGGRIHTLIRRALQERNIFFIKIARNMAFHYHIKDRFSEYADGIVEVMLQENNSDFALECIGLLGNLCPRDVDFTQLAEKYSLIPWIQQQLSSEETKDDIILEIVMLLGAAAYDESFSELLYQSGILMTLIQLLNEKQADDEIVLQIMYVFHQGLHHPMTRDYIVKQTDVPAYLVDLMHDNNPNVRKVCRVCLDLVKEVEESWKDRIKQEKFQWYNSDWLQMIQNQLLDVGYMEREMHSKQDKDKDENMDKLMTDSLLSASSRPASRYDSELDDLDVEINLSNLSREKDLLS